MELSLIHISEHSCWQYFCVLPDIKSVGVMGDERTYARPVIPVSYTHLDVYKRQR